MKKRDSLKGALVWRVSVSLCYGDQASVRDTIWDTYALIADYGEVAAMKARAMSLRAMKREGIEGAFPYVRIVELIAVLDA